MHSDQERLLESEFQRFVRLNWEIVTGAGRRALGARPNPKAPRSLRVVQQPLQLRLHLLQHVAVIRAVR